MSQPTYLEEKSERDHSMSVKQGTGEAFTPMEVLRDSHTMVKADCLKSSPQGYIAYPLARTLENNVTHCHTPFSAGYCFQGANGNFWWVNTVQTKDWQEDERTTYRVLLQEKATEHGMPYGSRGLWARNARSSRRVGKPRTWRRGVGSTDSREQGGARDA